ncbi:hypothetical protein G5V59_12850 [Nocardioides sp. W3-2-3]|uniref:hypothetical protein n=1 Tax=Nocardioides convexus TaxID=2712224 RepID=UPI0024187D35|nr:hypothetical protein [Nocardioides convexus]NHA00604.1 hypothetical protein [Nocardioides convexus]
MLAASSPTSTLGTAGSPIPQKHDDQRLADKQSASPIYTVSLHLRGLSSALAMTATDDGVRPGRTVAAQLARILRARGFMTATDTYEADVEPHPDGATALVDGRVNWYLTYLLVDSLAAWLEHDETLDEPLAGQLRDALRPAHSGAMLGVARMLALQESSMGGMFDALDLATCTATLLRAAKALKAVDLQTKAMARRGISVLLSDYLHRDGTFVPKSAPLVDSNHTQVVISSAELGESAAQRSHRCP